MTTTTTHTGSVASRTISGLTSPLAADGVTEKFDAKRPHGILGFLASHPIGALACLYLVLVIAASLFPDAFTRFDPTATVPAEKLQPPSLTHWFGTDQLGRDLYTRVVFGGRETIAASLLSLAIAVIGGVTLGLIAGYRGGIVDALFMRGVDVLLSIPYLLLAITIVTAIGFGTIPVAIAIGVGLLPSFARTIRSQVLKVRNRAFIDAARVNGVRPTMIVLRHVLPNSWGPVSVLALLDFGGVIMSVATLSFLGFGAQPPAAEWGSLINAGRSYLITSPWLSLLPGLVVVLTVLSVTVLSDSMRGKEQV